MWKIITMLISSSILMGNGNHMESVVVPHYLPHLKVEKSFRFDPLDMDDDELRMFADTNAQECEDAVRAMDFSHSCDAGTFRLVTKLAFRTQQPIPMPNSAWDVERLLYNTRVDHFSVLGNARQFSLTKLRKIGVGPFSTILELPLIGEMRALRTDEFAHLPAVGRHSPQSAFLLNYRDPLFPHGDWDAKGHMIVVGYGDGAFNLWLVYNIAAINLPRLAAVFSPLLDVVMGQARTNAIRESAYFASRFVEL